MAVLRVPGLFSAQPVRHVVLPRAVCLRRTAAGSTARVRVAGLQLATLAPCRSAPARFALPLRQRDLPGLADRLVSCPPGSLRRVVTAGSHPVPARCDSLVQIAD